MAVGADGGTYRVDGGGDGGGVVVALRALGLGDFCTGVPALRALRNEFPQHRLVLVAPSWQAPLAEAIGVDLVAAGELEPVATCLRGAQLAVNLHGTGPASTRLLMELRPARLIAFTHPQLPETSGSPAIVDGEHDRYRWCRLLQASGITADADDMYLPPPAARSPIETGTVIVHPGAKSAARRWPPERFAAVVAALRGAGLQVALTGSAGETELCRGIARAAGGGDVLAGATTTAQLCAAVAAATAVICNDTGIAHLASAYRTPSVVLFGPSSPASWGPPSDGPHRALWKGRTGDPHGDTVDPGLAAITVDEVLDACSVFPPWSDLWWTVAPIS